MKGIILAGGSGTRLYPLSCVMSKQLLPIYDKPMIYYPLSVLMNADIRDILIISTTQDLARYQDLLGDGSQFGIRISYKEQPSPDGLAQAFIIGEEFIGNDCVALILGDNVFIGEGLESKLAEAVQNAASGKGATVFCYPVSKDEAGQYGIAEIDDDGKIIGIEEKPERPKSNYCVTGLYFYDNRVIEYAKNLKPSSRNELEITDLNRKYLEQKHLNVAKLKQDITWFDTGTPDNLLEAAVCVRKMEQNSHKKIACPEEIAYQKQWIAEEDILAVFRRYPNNLYSQYLKEMLAENK